MFTVRVKRGPLFAVVLMVSVLMTCQYSIKKLTLPTPAYNLTASRELVKFAAVAFCDDKCIKTWTCKTGQPFKLTDILYIDQAVTKAHGYIGYRAQTNQIIASFRGSNNWQNWIEDANFQKLEFPDCIGCQVHAGFYTDYLSIEKQVNAHISTILSKYPTASLVTTGHSLGGAIAAICAVAVKIHFKTLKVQIHNFGQPRVGNNKLAQFMVDKLDGIYRVVHNKDIVPHVPPDLPGFDYQHPPYEIFFNEDLTSYKVCNASGEDKSCSNKFFPNYQPSDHDHYFIYISQTQC